MHMVSTFQVDIGPAKRSRLIGGIGGGIEANDSGVFPFGAAEVHISRESPENLFCWARLEDEADDMQYDKDDSLMEVDMGGRIFIFKRNSRNVYICDMEPHFLGNQLAYSATVADNERLYTKADIAGAIA
jgi:hypothetical protein